MSFNHVLKRLRSATESQSIRVAVDISDLRELLRDYDRIDAIHRDAYAQRERQNPVTVVKDNPFCPEGKSDEITEYLPVGTKLYSTPYAVGGARVIDEMPALDEHLRFILGRPNFWCYHLANALRAMGHEIARKAEEEQAAVIHWLLNAYFEHGPGWREAVEKIMEAEREKELAKGGEQ